MDCSLRDKVAIVTGGKGGIGKAIALALAKAGAHVVICGRVIEDGKLTAVANEIQTLGRRSLAVRADVTKRADVDNLVRKVIEEFGHIDILVNNAGILIYSPMLQLTEEDWDKIINTNLKGYYYCCQAVGKKMVEQKAGNIINIASEWGISAFPEAGAYCIAKAGVIMLTRVLALELASDNIRVNAIAPGPVKTDLLRAQSPDELDPEELKEIKAKVPLQHVAEPAEIAGTAVFLASEASSFITGSIIAVDGGKGAA